MLDARGRIKAMSSLFCEICGGDRRRDHRKGCTSEEAGLQVEMAAHRERMGELRSEWEVAAQRELVGTFWRYRSSYSSPKSDEDYWWLYLAIYEKDDKVQGLRFRIDKNGASKAEPVRHVFLEPSRGYEQITADDFWAAWREFQAHADALAKEAGL